MFSFNELEKTIEEIKKYDKLCIIVEGKKDKLVLEKVGLENVLDISGKTICEILDKIKSNNFQNTIILTDFDDEGKLKASQLTKLLQHHKIHILPNIRKKFMSFKIYKIEELKRFTKFMEDDHFGKTCSIYDKILDRSRFHHRWNGGKTRHNWSHIRPD